MWGFFSLYFRLQQVPAFSVTVMPLTWTDQAIPMQFWAWTPYLSLWLYTSLPPALQPNFRGLVYYAMCISLVCGVGLWCFYWWPTSVPPLIKPRHAQLQWLQGIDTAGNACPSLHVASVLFSCLWLRHQLRQLDAGRLWQLLNAVWGVLIVYSTLATKQHVVWDVIAGGALGGAGAWLSLSMADRMPWLNGRGVPPA